MTDRHRASIQVWDMRRPRAELAKELQAHWGNTLRIESWDMSAQPSITHTTPQNHPGAHRPTGRYVIEPCLSPHGKMLACVILEEQHYPRAVQVQLGEDGTTIQGSEREVVLPVDGAVRKVLYSPNGRWLACEVAPDGGEREQIWLVTTDPEDRNAYSLDMSSKATVELVCWDGNRLAVSAFDSDGVAEGRLLDPENGDYEVIDRRMGGLLVHARDGHGLFRVGNRGNRELLGVQPGGTWHPLLPVDTGSTTDNGYILRATTGPDGTSTLHALLRSDHSSGRAGLLEVRTFEGGRHFRTYAQREDADLDTFAVSLDNSTAVLLWNHQGRSEIEIMDLTGDAPRTIVCPTLPAVVAKSPSLTSDGCLLALEVSGFEFPPRVVLYDVVNKRWTGDTNVHRNINDNSEADSPALIADPEPMRTTSGPVDAEGRAVIAGTGSPTVIPELHTFPARDGVELSGWLFRGAGTTPGEPGPIMIHLHGGPEGQSRPSYNNVLRWVSEAGISVFAPNVRGSAGNGRWFSHADDRYGRFAGIDDVEDCLDYCIAQRIADPAKAIIAGRSYGGYLVHASLTRHAGRWIGGIAVCGMSDLETFYRDTETWIAAAAHPKYGHPQLDRELLVELSPIHQMHKVRVPVLFVHGAHDTNVPVSEAYQAMGVLSANGVPNDILFFDDEGHAFEKLANRRTIAVRVCEFCRGVLDAAEVAEAAEAEQNQQEEPSSEH